MKLAFHDAPVAYNSGAQRAKAWTEHWVSQWAYCPNCGHERLTQFPANLPVADFYCSRCQDQFELKSQKKPFGAKVADGAYSAKQERLSSSTNPNLMLISYDLPTRSVRELSIVPKHFFTPDIVEKRKPLASTARRAGWVGSNILLARVPHAGRIFVIRSGELVPKDTVLERWRQTTFLRSESLESRSWLIEVMRCVDSIASPVFSIEEVYNFENYLSSLYPNNNNVRPKIRQQLQFLRDMGYIEFVSRGNYRRTPHSRI